MASQCFDGDGSLDIPEATVAATRAEMANLLNIFAETG